MAACKPDDGSSQTEVISINRLIARSYTPSDAQTNQRLLWHMQ